MSLVTTCPSCGTIFRMVREQLEASEGRVRCGHCMQVFDAKSQLDAQAPELPAESSRTVDSSEQAAQQHLSFVKQARQQAFWSQPAVRAGLVILCILLIAGLAVQVIRSERDRFAASGSPVAPVAHKLCQWLACTPNNKRNIEAWQIDATSFQKEAVANKTSGAAFRLNLQIKNTSATLLLLPHLELSLLDASDTLLVRKVMALNDGDAAASVASLDERRFKLLVTTSASQLSVARDVAGYRAVLFYP